MVIAALLTTGCLGPALPLGTRAEDCGTCHEAQRAQWQGSRHAASARSPVFEAMLAPVEKAWGTAAKARCVACHAPGHGGDEGIGCVTCHAAVGNRGERNGALVVDLDAPLAGPGGDVDTPAHRTTTRGFLSSASLCGTCHEVHGPGLLEEPTLTEFRASPFGSGDRCLGCHGGEGESQDHRFVGLDPPWGAPPEMAARAAEDARGLLERALCLEVQHDEAGVKVTLVSEQTGHAVPTGITALRDVWVDVEWTDALGHRVVQPRVMELGARLTRDGVEVALFTDATLIEPRGLSPGESRAWRAPPGSHSVVATLKARAVRASALSALGLDALASEVPELVVRSAGGQ